MGDRFDELDRDMEATKSNEYYEKPDGQFDEEYGAELTPPAAPLFVNNRVRADQGDVPDHPEPNRDLHAEEGAGVETGGATIGWIGLVLAIASLFIYPAILGTGGIVLGIIAYVQGSRALGAWSVIIGGIALLSFVVLVPYYT
ncbi:hypothetical protein [Paenibacillus oceani]|uniref:DUF4190 domain-containing protein n=1 Tax=Paenibacillus oceani TaxID=2772510 RepID=A0A927C5R7_9BACL|nr:hypothetical protein [Paenibacillus oceani]MBD2861765.1 hypothetical protein [Paenibacillus oceani]